MEELFSTRAWALESSYFDRMSPVILDRIRLGHDLSFIKKPTIKDEDTPAMSIGASVVGMWDIESQLFVYENEETGSRVAEISMTGVLSKYGGMCTPGSRSMIQQINRANANKKIDAITLFTDGPGGAVSGTTELGMAIQGSEKPIIAYIDEMAASAHYWVVSQSDYIVANAYDYTQVGSIGVLCQLISQKEWLTKKGLEVTIMRASQSSDKARLNSIEDFPEESLNRLQKELDQTADDFKAAVIAGRGDRLSTVDENIFTGKMYDADTAQSMGMIDYQGTYLDAIYLAADIANSRKTATN